MNILLTTSCAIPSGGGVASYNEELVCLLGKTNDIYLITAANEKDVEGYVQTMSTYGHDWNKYEYSKKILDQIDVWNIDLIINSDSSMMAVLAPFVKIPIVSVSHFVDGVCALKAGYNSKYLSYIIALSNYGKRFLEKNFDISDKDKVKVIYNFVAEKNLQNPSYKIERTKLKIVYPGGTSIKKSVDVVMRTLYRLLKSDLDFNFVWLGQTKLPLANVSPHKEITQFFPKDCRLLITGKVSREEAIRYMEDANVFLLPSRGEGCPMTLLEAMRAGCIPVVSDARHGSREILEMGDFGVIVKQGDSKQLFESLKDIIQNREKYSENYYSTYSFSREHLSQNVWAKQMNDVISSIANEEKKSIEFSKRNFENSNSGFERFYNSYRRREKVHSIISRLYYEFLYYFIR